MRWAASETLLWKLVAVLTVISAGAYLGNENAQYFWDLKVYVEALDSPFPYRYDQPYPFLYPPVAKQIFTMARSHLFELLSIAYVASAALLVSAVARLRVPRKFEWMAAMTSLGGLGVVSLMSGNVAILLNLTLLAVALQTGLGSPLAHAALPLVIFMGALIKPQFVVYAGLLLIVERSVKAGIVKAAGVVAAAAAVHLLYTQLQPVDWSEYSQALVKRTVVEKDFAWGPAGFIKHFSDSNAAALAAFAAGFVLVAGLAFATYQRSRRDGARVPPAALASLVFLALTFANPRMPPYDVFVAFLALAVCCSYAARQGIMVRLLALLLAMNLVPWLIREFARTPSAWTGWLQDVQLGQLLGLVSLLAALSRVGFAGDGNPERAL
jgi:hypothetical protein